MPELAPTWPSNYKEPDQDGEPRTQAPADRPMRAALAAQRFRLTGIQTVWAHVRRWYWAC